jgi:hypothetical protein
MDAVRDASREVSELFPQARYAKAAKSRLHRHGAGPFADLIPPPLPHESGVYVLAAEGVPKYVGMAVDLAERWGPRGYSRIHPRNCFVGGQSTNCKVNTAILHLMKVRVEPDLWFRICADPRPIERTLIQVLEPEWNANA